jgi:hypothetical protein
VHRPRIERGVALARDRARLTGLSDAARQTRIASGASGPS